MIRSLFGVGGFSGLVAVIEATIPLPPEAADPLSWAFVACVLCVLAGAGWLVRFHATTGAAAQRSMAESMARLADSVKSLEQEVRRRP
jgi:hypothetical protein